MAKMLSGVHEKLFSMYWETLRNLVECFSRMDGCSGGASQHR